MRLTLLHGLGLAGAATCVAAYALLPRPSGRVGELVAAPRAQDAGAAATDDPNASLASRVDELAAQLEELRARVVALEARPAASPRTPLAEEPGAWATRAELDLLRAEVARLSRSAPAPAVPRDAPPEDELEAFRAQVADVLGEIRREEARAGLRALARKEERLGETLISLREWLGLGGEEVETLRTVLQADHQREGDRLRRLEKGESPEVLAEMERTDRAVHLEEIAEVLTPEQFQRYAARFRRDGG